MPNGQPNKKKSKKAVFTIYLKYGGIFITNPLSYVEGISREINDINFDGVSFNILVEIINKLMLGNCHSIKKLYYCKTGTTLALGVKELKYDKDVEDMLNDGYDNGNMIDLFIEHYGHDLWYMKNDWRSVLVYCGRNVAEGRYACKKGNKNRVLPNKDRNYNLGSLVNFKWIAAHYGKEIIGQCKRAKQRALYDHEGGLIEHYSRLYDYMQAILDTNHGSTYRLDMFESDGSPYFKRMYICIKGVKDGWLAGCRKVIACSTIEKQFQKHMEQIKLLDPLAYDYLVQRDPNTWSIAFFEMDRRCEAFENGISESFNKAILSPRSKPIITMLEEIRLYIMQRLFAMNKIAVNLEDDITPSIRKRLEVLKEKQSGFQELEVRNGDESYAVNLQHKFSIKPMTGSRYWKRTNIAPPLPPLINKMSGRPQKQRIKSPIEDNSTKVSKVGRKRQPNTSETASKGGLGSRGGRRGGRGKGGGNNSRGGGNSSREGPSSGARTKKLWSDGHLTAQQEYELSLDEEAFRETIEEKDRLKQEYLNRHRRSKRIANQKHKFDPMGTGSTPEKALSVSDSD
nr:hypothetical protein [Tanacetum cinerariifolium]